MNNFSHARYLSDQYGNAQKLSSRIDLHRMFSTSSVSWETWLFSQLRVPETCSVLELGCGNGSFWRVNARLIPPGWNCIISDKSAAMLAAAKANCPLNTFQASFEVVDAEYIPFSNSTFDAVIANHMLYHVGDLTRCLTEIRRVLHPSGVLCASTNGPGHMKEIRDIAQEVCPEAADLWDAQSEVISRFDLQSGEPVLRRFFSDVQIATFNDELDVTKPEPLIAYMLSGPMGAPLSERASDLSKIIEHKLNRSGAIKITKVCGAFLATNAESA